MECSVCGSAEPVARCTTCKQLICKQHGVRCQGCGKALCPHHRLKAGDGRTLCAGCMAKMETPATESFSFESLTADAPPLPAAPIEKPPAHAPRGDVAPPPAAPESSGGGFSFEDLARDGGQLPGSQPNDPDAPALVNPITGFEEVPDPEVDKKLAMMLGENEGGIRMEALGGSNRGTPIWLSGMYAGGIAILLTMPLIFSSGFDMFQPIYSYSILLVAGGAVFYAIYGFIQKDDTPRERYLCTIALVLGFLAAFIALYYSGGSSSS